MTVNVSTAEVLREHRELVPASVAVGELCEFGIDRATAGRVDDVDCFLEGHGYINMTDLVDMVNRVGQVGMIVLLLSLGSQPDPLQRSCDVRRSHRCRIRRTRSARCLLDP
jgi:hypothetical protein